MSTAPASLVAVGDYWEAQGGNNLGIVGNTAHTVGYHLGKDRIYDGSGPGIGDRDYSVQLPRDVAGLTNAASAIDLGRLDGSLTKLRKFSQWMVDRCLADAEYRRAFREIIYSPDGVYVKRYSRPDNKVIISLRKNADGSVTVINPGNGDATHFSHTHLSFMRDTRSWNLVDWFRPYFETGAEPVPVFKAFAKPKFVTVPDKGWLYVKPDLSTDPGNVQIDPGPRDMPVAGSLSDGTLIVGYVDATPTEPSLPTYYFKGTPKDYPTGTTPVPPDAVSCKPFTDPLEQTIAKLEADLVTAAKTERTRIADAEAARIQSI